MKYKLIHKQIGEEHLCDKVVIDGFDYYVSDETIKIGEINIPSDFSRVTDLSMTSSSDLPIVNDKANGYKKVVATNNPNIDVPKVVDEVAILAEKFIGCKYEDIEDSIDQIGYDSFKRGYNKSQETHPFSEEDMIEFYEWCNYPIYRADGELGFRTRVQAQFPEYNTYIVINETGQSIYPKGVFLTTKELLQLWEEQKLKIVYYEESSN